MNIWNNSVQYSSDDMMRMQREAIQRVQEMQRRAQNRVSQSSWEDTAPPPPQPTPPVFPTATTGNPPPSMGRTPSPSGMRGNNQPPHNSGGLLGNLLGSGLGDTVSNITDIPKKAFSSISSVLEGFGLDNEKIILIILIFLLANEDGDKTLLLALGYLLFF